MHLLASKLDGTCIANSVIVRSK